jgi:hypothetical protein
MIDNKENTYIGKCLFSNMLAVPYRAIIPVNVNNKPALYQKKIRYLEDNKKRIYTDAKRIYTQKERGYNQKYLDSTVDFKKIEKFCIQWEIQKYGKHVNRFPDGEYFLTNPNIDGISEYYLMNKKKRIAKLSINNATQKVEQVIEVYNQAIAPLECITNKVINAIDITNWFRSRGIPTWRDGLDDFLENMGVKSKDVLLNKAFGLSLSDQYWMNPVELYMDWEDINFFTNDFNSKDYIEACFENKILDEKEIDFFSPNNTSDGMLKKAWIVDNHKRYLLKGGFKLKELEPFNEVLASMIANTLQLPHVNYALEILKGIIVSKCEGFITKDNELISAYAILKYNNSLSLEGEALYKEYIHILEEQGLLNVKEYLVKMFCWII